MSIDETVSSLNHIFEADRARKGSSLSLLRSAVGRLDGSTLPLVDEPTPEGHGRSTRDGVTDRSEPFVPLPKRTTHGGRFGPAVRAKLRAAALER